MGTSGEERLGQFVGRYRLARVLGVGGASVVYLGHSVDEPAARVAVKVLVYPAALAPADRATFRARFLREARAAPRLRHEHILPVLEYGEAGDLTYMVMPYLPGDTLAARLKDAGGPLPLGEIADILRQVAGALDYAHRQGIVHRDVKPSNILLDERGQFYLTDFGIAHLFDVGAGGLTADRIAALTVTGQVLGTPYYMSPEQVKGEPVGPAADVYALGVVLYLLATGRLPFEGDSVLVVAMHHVQDAPRPPSELRPELPPDAERAILRALAKQPADRFASAGALADAFERAIRPIAAAPSDARTASPPPHGRVGAAPDDGPDAPGEFRALVGQAIGGYRLEELLAPTDLGPVYRARGERDGAPCRLRLLAIRGGQTPESRSLALGRFQQLARDVAELRHPSLAPLRDYGTVRGRPYLVTPQPPGPSLAERVAEAGPLDPATAGRYLEDLAAALEYVHGQGLAHGNLTADCAFVRGPAEIALADVAVREMFQLGGPPAPGSPPSRDSEAPSPEQLLGGPASAAADVYALGAVLYQMLTGRPLYGDDVAQQRLHAPIPSARAARADLPDGLDAILARALAKDPGRRYQRPGELAAAYARLIADAGRAPTPGGRLEPTLPAGLPADLPSPAGSAPSPPAPPGGARPSLLPSKIAAVKLAAVKLGPRPLLVGGGSVLLVALLLLLLAGKGWPFAGGGRTASPTASGPTATPATEPASYQVTTYETHGDIPYSAGGEPPPLSTSCGSNDETLLSGGYRIDERGAPADTHPSGATASYPSGPRTWTAAAYNGVRGATLTLYVTAYCLRANFGLDAAPKSNDARVDAGGRNGTTADCGGGYAIGGGFRLTRAAGAIVVQSRPSVDAGGAPRGWMAAARDASGRGADLMVYALCAARNVTGGSVAGSALTLDAGKSADAQQACPEGQLATGGGFEMQAGGQPDEGAERHVVPFVDHIPGSPGPSQRVWKVAAYNADSARHTIQLRADCLRLPDRVAG